MVALGELDGPDGWTYDRWTEALDEYFAEHDSIGTDGMARSAAFVELDETGRRWTVRQVLDDPAGDHDWMLTAEIDLDASDDAGVAVLRLLDVGRR